YSWMNRFEKRYSIVAIYFASQRRIPKASYYWYQKIIVSNGKLIKRKHY
ncbi:glycosyl hydrolase family protein, partial [Lactobacillus sp. XV13L]|nr:glycosyl hydrolase family protein [Lactobacillus sp. XV13L]